MKVTIQDSRTSVTVEPRDFRVTVSGARGPQGEPGEGIAPGGTEGQILAKASAADYDTEWIDNFAPNVEVYVKNSSGSAMAKGQIVYISGADGTHPTVSLAIATTEMGSSKTIGWLKQDLANGDLGYVVTEGLLEGINTNGASAAGDPVWLSPTTAGGVVYGLANKPSAPNHMVFLGYVLRKQTNNGKVYVKVQNGFELGELHDVYDGAKTTPVSADTLLLRDSADSNLWKRLTWANAMVGVKTHMDTYKGVAGGYASLDGSGKVPASELPSYVDDVVEVANYAALPVTGETGKIYVTLDNNKCYRWTGSVYVEVSAGGGIDTLTTTGTSGAATLVGSTLNIPQYQSVLTNPVTGTGASGQVAYFNGTSSVAGSSSFTWDPINNNLGIGGAPISNRKLFVSGVTRLNDLTFGAAGNAAISNTSNLILNLTAATGLGISSGSTLTATAMLHVRGSGTTSSTTALLVQNSTPTELFKVLDNGAWNFNGDGIITGSGNTSATTALTVRNSSNTKVIEARNDSDLYLGNNSWLAVGNSQRYLYRYLNLTGIFSIGNDGAVGSIINLYGSSHATRPRTIDVTSTYAPTSGSVVFATWELIPTINQTGGANGITRGLYVNPTLTAAANWRSIETSNNTGYAAYFAGSADLFFNDATDLQFGTTTGTKIGTATSQKIGLWNATPIVQPTTGVAAATRVGGGGTTLTDTDTFDGYTISQVVKALRNIGALA